MKFHCIVCSKIHGDFVTLSRHIKEKHKPKVKKDSFFG
mgnify:CR=1 FL=1